MRKNDKNLEIETTGIIQGTKVHYVLLKGGQMYYRIQDLCKMPETYPGQYRETVSVIAYRDLYITATKKEALFRYVRVWYDGHQYIHETDLRNYIMERQAGIENRLSFHTGNPGGWTLEATRVIKQLFNMIVRCNRKHERITAPEEIADRYANNPKLRAAFVAYNNMIRGLKIQRRLAPYWAECVELDEQLRAWESKMKEENEE